ncbi:MAG: class I SAM-dependent methyltransferase [Actinomycetales bacterium]
MTEELSGARFADAAAGRPAFVREQSLALVREADLPDDWLATTLACYSTEADYYELAQYPHTEPMKVRVNEFAVEQIATTKARAVLDVGVGDGHRLARICASVAAVRGGPPQMYGVELSDRMIERARARGVQVLKHDMREGIPDLGRDLDAVLFLSGDLGFLMDAETGPELRLQALDSAHQRLSDGGKVVLELVTRDPRVAEHGADVFHFSRRPRVDGAGGPDVVSGPETWQFIKTFTRAELVSLVESSRFDLAAATMRYIVRDSPDVDRIGQYVRDDEIVSEESYRLLVSLVK